MLEKLQSVFTKRQSWKDNITEIFLTSLIEFFRKSGSEPCCLHRLLIIHIRL